MISSTLILALVLGVMAPPGYAQQTEKEPYHNPYLRAFESLAVPGLGQWHNGDNGGATVWVMNSIVSLLFASKFISFGGSENTIRFWRVAGWVSYGLGAATSAYDAYRGARSMNKENGYDIEEFGNSLLQGEGPSVRVTILKHEF